MKISVIIPARCSQETLGICLQSVYDNTHPPHEVIVVECGPDPHVYERFAAQFPAKFIHVGENGSGKGTARNKGIENAEGDVLVLVDADIAVPRTAFARVVETFKHAPEIDVVNGMLAKECPHSDFFSRYKNLYMNYRFSRMPEDIDFLFTSFTAFRRTTAVVFRDTYKPKDTETGQKMAKEEGRHIHFDRGLEVVHWKKYTLRKLLYNDFIVPHGWAKIFWQFDGLKDLSSKGRFAHATNDQVFSVVLASLSVPALVLSALQPEFLVPAPGAITGHIWLNRRFFGFVNTHAGKWYTLKSVLFTYLDNIVMGIAIGAGFAEVFVDMIRNALRFGIHGLRTILGTNR